MTTLQHAALAIAAVFLDSLWQGALIAGAAWAGLRCFPRLGASTRYAIWLCTLLAIAVTPLFTVAAGGHGFSFHTLAAATTARTNISPAVPPPQPGRQQGARQPAHMSAQSTAESHPLAPAALAFPTPPAERMQLEIPTTVALSIALAWLLAVLARGALLLADLRDLVSVRRYARVWSTKYAYPVLQSDRVRVPVAIGFIQPAVVLPEELVDELDADALEAVVTHEIAHLQRYDVWTNALARVAQALLALNPAAWFVMRRLSVEREIACDDCVVDRTGAGETLAHTLFAIASDTSRRIPIAAPSAFGSRHAIVVRIERLLDARPRRLRLSPVAFGGALMALALIALVIGSVAPVLAYAPVQELPALIEAPGQHVRAQAVAATSPAGACAVPNRGVELSFPTARTRRGGPTGRVSLALPSAEDAVARYGAAGVAIVDLTVDARGKARKVVVVSAPSYPGMSQHVKRRLLADSYEPALRSCAPVATTVHVGIFVPKPEQHSVSVIEPVYPNGWAAAHASACKLPTETHARYRSGFVPGTAYTQMLPAFPDAMKDIGVDETFSTTVRVHANASGTVTDAAIVKSSGRAAFDDATISAARQATYPLTTSTCKPLPSEYVWTTTFATQAFLP
ncbi:MAG: hypothetical protein QOJ39_546 [Candidatus Eremiobacteraeota bacterium]|jgi:TonB family protein|nr:hypothetical protein [Candidatus Eremiobacteraeota bacterium]